MLVNKAHLCVRHAASKDETRYNLNGVHFRGVEHPAEGSALVVTEATDGHMLLRVTAPSSPDSEYPAAPVEAQGFALSDEDPEPFILPLGAAEELHAVLRWTPKRRSSMPILADALLDVPHANSNGAVRFLASDLESVRRVESKKIDGEYPNTDSVIPSKLDPATGKERPPTFAINLALLERVMKAAREGGFATWTGSVVARFYVDPEAAAVSPLRIEVVNPDVGELLAIVMPMRV